MSPVDTRWALTKCLNYKIRGATRFAAGMLMLSDFRFHLRSKLLNRLISKFLEKIQRKIASEEIGRGTSVDRRPRSKRLWPSVVRPFEWTYVDFCQTGSFEGEILKRF